jgi:hypothetical protein
MSKDTEEMKQEIDSTAQAQQEGQSKKKDASDSDNEDVEETKADSSHQK